MSWNKLVEIYQNMNLELFPPHCVNCNVLEGCLQKRYMVSGTKPVIGWEGSPISSGMIWCSSCFPSGTPVTAIDSSQERDSPIHCIACGIPIQHSLSLKGIDHVRNVLRMGAGCYRIIWREIWGPQLGFVGHTTNVLKQANTHPDAKVCADCGTILKDPLPGVPLYKHCPKCEP
jgi:hypothetical protein